MKPGDIVGYGGAFTAEQRMRIGVVACGYADGYPRHAPSGTPVLVDGRRTRTVGRVSMDMLCVDLTRSAGRWRRRARWCCGAKGMPVEEVATAAGTSSYELLCALARGCRSWRAALIARWPRPRSIYSCSECGGQTLKWQGQCPHCGAWNTLVETIAEKATARYQGLAAASQVQTPGRGASRRGAAPGNRNRRAGPRAGRRTGARGRGAARRRSGDRQVHLAAAGLEPLVEQLHGAVCERRGERAAGGVALAPAGAREQQSQGAGGDPAGEDPRGAAGARQPDVAVIDSIQTVYSEALQSAPGSVAQVRECAAQLTRFAKTSGTSLLFVGHVTKEGAIAGPRVLEHMVDSVLYFEGDTHSSFRLVRAIKNRFGAVNELGVFAMTDKGLRGVANPSALFLSQHGGEVAGSCVLVTQEGTRPLLVEIQALVDESHAPNARRLTVGLEQNRLAMLLAVLHRHAGVAAFDQDVFVNAVGGVKIDEPAADLAILLAIVSSLRNKPLPRQAGGVRRGWTGGRGASGSARAGAPARGGQAGLHAGADPARQRTEGRDRGTGGDRSGAGG